MPGMSIDLYEERLIWNAHRSRGVAKSCGREVTLHRCPDIFGARVDEVDFAPAFGTVMIREYAAGWREMHGHEIEAASSFLETVARGES